MSTYKGHFKSQSKSVVHRLVLYRKNFIRSRPAINNPMTSKHSG